MGGRLRRRHGALLTCDGLAGLASIGDTCLVARRGHNHYVCQTMPGEGAAALLAEVVGVDEDGVHLLPFDDVTGIGVGAEVSLVPGYHAVRPAAGWLGRAGSITALATVLAEGDDLNDPVVDAVRAILDGHIVLDRAIADGGRFPAIDVLRSLSRSTPGCWPPERRAITRARRLIKTHADMAELIQLGAYRSGTDPAVDDAIRARPALEALLAQEVEERSSLDADFGRLAEAVGDAMPTT